MFSWKFSLSNLRYCTSYLNMITVCTDFSILFGDHFCTHNAALLVFDLGHFSGVIAHINARPFRKCWETVFRRDYFTWQVSKHAIKHTSRTLYFWVSCSRAMDSAKCVIGPFQNYQFQRGIQRAPIAACDKRCQIGQLSAHRLPISAHLSSFTDKKTTSCTAALWML